MSDRKELYEKYIRKKRIRSITKQVLAAGALRAKEAI